MYFQLMFAYSAVEYCLWRYLSYFFFPSLTAEVQKDLPHDKEEGPWLELVPSFSGEIYEAQPETIQADYGLKHGYDSDTESTGIKTCSTTTQFDMLHEDDLEEFTSFGPSDLKTGELMHITSTHTNAVISTPH